LDPCHLCVKDTNRTDALIKIADGKICSQKIALKRVAAMCRATERRSKKQTKAAYTMEERKVQVLND